MFGTLEQCGSWYLGSSSLTSTTLLTIKWTWEEVCCLRRRMLIMLAWVLMVHVRFMMSNLTVLPNHLSMLRPEVCFT